MQFILKIFILSLAKYDTNANTRKVSFDCETHSLSNDSNKEKDSSITETGNNLLQCDEESVVTLDGIRELRRGCPVPREGLMCDLLWADPQVRIPFFNSSNAKYEALT